VRACVRLRHTHGAAHSLLIFSHTRLQHASLYLPCHLAAIETRTLALALALSLEVWAPRAGRSLVAL